MKTLWAQGWWHKCPRSSRGRDQLGLGLERRKNWVHEEGVSEAGKVAAKAEMNWGVCVCAHTRAHQCVSASAHVCFYVL